MNRKLRFGSISAGNPVANALLAVIAALAVVAAIVLGFFALVVFLGIVVVFVCVAAIRLWWFGRKLRAVRDQGRPPGEAKPARVIEGEYTVVSSRGGRRGRDSSAPGTRAERDD